MKRNKSLGVNAILNGIKSLMSVLFPLITFPYVSKVLQVGNLGKYNFASSVNSYFLLLSALFFSYSNVKFNLQDYSLCCSFSQNYSPDCFFQPQLKQATVNILYTPRNWLFQTRNLQYTTKKTKTDNCICNYYQ